MKNEIRNLYDICEKINKRFDNNLIEHDDLVDLKNNIEDYLDSDWESLNEGLRTFNNLNWEQLESSNDDAYVKGFVSIYSGLTNIIEYLQDIDDAMTKINRKFMLLSGEITKEEYNHSLEITPEDTGTPD